MKKVIVSILTVAFLVCACGVVGNFASADVTVQTFNELFVGEYTTANHSGMAHIIFAKVPEDSSSYGVIVEDEAGVQRRYEGKVIGAEGKFGIALYNVPEGNYIARAYAGEESERVYGNDVPFTVGDSDTYYTRVGNTVIMGKVAGDLVVDEAIIAGLKTAQKDADGVLSYNGKTYAEVVAKPYASDYAYEAGETYYFEMVDLEWTIISESATELVIITKDIIGASAYNAEYVNVDYANASVKSYLESLRTLVLSEVQEQNVMAFDLPSVAQVETMTDKTALTSPFATASGIYTEDLAGFVGNGMYWLSDSGTVANYASYVDFSGEINPNGYGYMVNAPYIGVRAVATITIG